MQRLAIFSILQRMPHDKSMEEDSSARYSDLRHLQHHADLLDEVDALTTSFALVC